MEKMRHCSVGVGFFGRRGFFPQVINLKCSNVKSKVLLTTRFPMDNRIRFNVMIWIFLFSSITQNQLERRCRLSSSEICSRQKSKCLVLT